MNPSASAGNATNSPMPVSPAATHRSGASFGDLIASGAFVRSADQNGFRIMIVARPSISHTKCVT